MVQPILRTLVEPHPWLDFPEPWFHFRHFGRHWKRAWDVTARQAIRTGSAEELHTAREDYEAVLRGHLKMLDGYLLVLERFNGEVPHREVLDRLVESRDELRRHYDSLFPRWQTLDDLEAILLDSISPTHDQLKARAASHPPSRAWHDEPSTPTAE